MIIEIHPHNIYRKERYGNYHIKYLHFMCPEIMENYIWK